MAWFIKRHLGIPFSQLIGALIFVSTALPVSAELPLSQAIEIAHQNDPWIEGSLQRQRALETQSTAASTLPDPVMSLGLANMPIDTFDFDQEAMTQFKFGVTQIVPRGSSLELNQKRLAIQGSQQPYQRADRKARVTVNVSQLWLETFRATESIRLIEEDRELFEHLVDVAQSSYSTAVGKTRQQDLVRAQLELTRLEDRLTMLHERLDMSRTRLGEWLLTGTPDDSKLWSSSEAKWFSLPSVLPRILPQRPDLLSSERQPTAQEIGSLLVSHPAIANLDNKIRASATGVEIAEQKYKPEWKINASYGYRDDAPNGMDRADFFSVGVAFDLPLFTSNRQDQQVQSAIATTEAVRTERSLALRNMVSAFETQRARLLRLDQRRDLYQSRLLEEMHEQAEASLSAYTNDDGDFAEVVRARIAELNARIDALDIEIERLKTIAQLNYFFTTSDA
jgi:outer membrane protein TolC